MASARSRTRLIEQVRARGVADERVLEAMSRVPRHEFLDEAMASRAYDDTALPIGYGQTISQPSVVAEMTALATEQGVPESVLEVGTGSGYQAAILAELGALVYTVERIEPLYRLARARFQRLGYHRVRASLAADDTLGLPGRAPFSAILVTAGSDTLPEALFEQLAEGGVMIAPIAEAGVQRLTIVRRNYGERTRAARTPVVFVPLIYGDASTR